MPCTDASRVCRRWRRGLRGARRAGAGGGGGRGGVPGASAAALSDSREAALIRRWSTWTVPWCLPAGARCPSSRAWTPRPMGVSAKGVLALRAVRCHAVPCCRSCLRAVTSGVLQQLSECKTSYLVKLIANQLVMAPSGDAADGRYELIVVSPRSYFLYTPLLPSAAAGTVQVRSGRRVDSSTWAWCAGGCAQRVASPARQRRQLDKQNLLRFAAGPSVDTGAPSICPPLSVPPPPPGAKHHGARPEPAQRLGEPGQSSAGSWQRCVRRLGRLHTSGLITTPCSSPRLGFAAGNLLPGGGHHHRPRAPRADLRRGKVRRVPVATACCSLLLAVAALRCRPAPWKSASCAGASPLPASLLLLRCWPSTCRVCRAPCAPCWGRTRGASAWAERPAPVNTRTDGICECMAVKLPSAPLQVRRVHHPGAGGGQVRGQGRDGVRRQAEHV